MKRFQEFLQTTPSYEHWQEIGIFPRHGLIIPVFSLKTLKSSGIGEFTDLLPLIDYCSEVGLNLIQILPINEMSHDHSPYNALSSCALDPVYLGLSSLPYIEESSHLIDLLNHAQELNQEPRVRWDKVKKRKRDFLYQYFRLFFSRFQKLHHYEIFVKQNPWVSEYALFLFLREKELNKHWINWERKHKGLKEEVEQKLLETHQDELNFYIFLQYLCFQQMIEVKEYASKKNILLVGDIPILINADSVDVWKNPPSFDLSHVAGCPPDDFSDSGQKWGFPLFRWEKMKQTGFAWWKRRLQVASSYYHMYRIDHVVGFFRIWAIRHTEDPLQGKFLPLDPAHWEAQGKELLLMMLKASPLLPIAEDLGMIPPCTYRILKELGIPGMKLFLTERDDEKHLLPFKKYPPLSATMLATHDLPLLATWWEQNRDLAQILCVDLKIPYQKKLSLEMRLHILKATHATTSVFHMNLFQEYLALEPSFIFQNPIDEQINQAGTFLERNWSYRMKVDLETVKKHENLKKHFQTILSL